METPSKFDYAAFITEVRALEGAAQRVMKEADYDYDHPTFRHWKHVGVEVIGRIRGLGYRPNIQLSGRLFRAAFPGAKPTENKRSFESDMHDTLIEMGTLVTMFERYGDTGPHRGLKLSTGNMTEPAPLVLAPDEKPAKGETLKPVPTTVEPADRSAKAEAPKPEKITVRWLIDYVPWQMWVSAAFATVTVFGAGFSAASMPIGLKVRAMFTEAAVTPTPTQQTDSPMDKSSK